MEIRSKKKHQFLLINSKTLVQCRSLKVLTIGMCFETLWTREIANGCSNRAELFSTSSKNTLIIKYKKSTPSHTVFC